MASPRWPAPEEFIDEVGVDIAMSCSYGWAPRGVTPVIERPARGRRISLIGATALDGCRALRRVEGYVDGDELISFLREDLGPHLNPGACGNELENMSTPQRSADRKRERVT